MVGDGDGSCLRLALPHLDFPQNDQMIKQIHLIEFPASASIVIPLHRDLLLEDLRDSHK